MAGRTFEMINVPRINNNPFSFSGRIRRISYLCAIFVSSLIGSFANFLSGIAERGNKLTEGVAIFLLCLCAFSLWVGLAAAIKRLRDLDANLWLILLMFIPLANLILGLYLLFGRSKIDRILKETAAPNDYAVSFVNSSTPGNTINTIK